MFTFKSLILWLHLAAIVVWIGGIFSTTFVLLPLLQRTTSFPKEFLGIIERIARRFQNISWEAVGIIFLTGIFNLINTALERDFNFSSTYMRVVALKLLLLVAIIAIQSFQNYRVLPRIFSAAAVPPDTGLTPGFDSIDELRKKAMLLPILNLVLAAMVIYLGLGLRHQ